MFKQLLTLGALGVISHSVSAEPTTLRSGIVVDAQQNQALVMLPGGGIAALDILTGTTSWSSAASDKPVVLKSGQLLSQKRHKQTGALAMVYHDSSTGQVLNQSTIQLPDNVVASVVDGAGHQFKLEHNSNNTAQLQWTFAGGTAQGMGPDSLLMATERSAGDLTEPARQAGIINFNFADLSVAATSTTLTAEPVLASTEQTVLTDQPGRQFTSPNGQYVLVSERIPSNQAINFKWAIYARTGQVLGELTAPMSYAPFTVAGDLLLYLAPATGQIINGELVKNPPLLKAFNLKEQQQVWEQPVRDIKYFGQMPI